MKVTMEHLYPKSISSLWSEQLDVPRDRNGNFEPEIVKRNQTSITSEIEDLSALRV